MEGEGGVEVYAAGGVIVRQRAGHPELAAVHRPKYDDWSLPKGKLNAGEDFEAAALREVEEETGLRCRLGPELPSTRYRDARGRFKMVRYWLMEPLSGEFRPNKEVDELRWVDPETAAGVLSYERDRELVRRALATM